MLRVGGRAAAIAVALAVLGALRLSVPIHRLLEPGVFQPEEIAALGHVFDDVLHTLGLVDRTDPVTTLVARKLIDLAQTGERNPDRLRRMTIDAFRGKANQKFETDPPGTLVRRILP